MGQEAEADFDPACKFVLCPLTNRETKQGLWAESGHCLRWSKRQKSSGRDCWNQAKRKISLRFAQIGAFEWPIWWNVLHCQMSDATNANVFCVSNSCICTSPVCPASYQFVDRAAKGSFSGFGPTSEEPPYPRRVVLEFGAVLVFEPRLLGKWRGNKHHYPSQSDNHGPRRC